MCDTFEAPNLDAQRAAYGSFRNFEPISLKPLLELEPLFHLTLHLEFGKNLMSRAWE